MSTPIVSVVIPFYSGKKWLESAIESVLSQSFKNFEILVINDGSKEDVSDLQLKYDNNVYFIKQSNGGPAKARNTGIQKSKGKYIAFLDSDDLWESDKLEKQVGYMEKNNLMWSQHSYLMFWEDGTKEKIIDTSKYQGDVLKDTFISFKVQTSTVVVRRDVIIDKNIKFPPGKRYGEDGTFYRQLAQLYPLGYVDGILSKFRVRGNNAGFRTDVQLLARANAWNEIKNDKEVLKILPKNVIFAYKISNFNAKISKKIIKKDNRDNRWHTWMYNLLYLMPYFLFKMSS